MAGLIHKTTKKLECLAARSKVVYNVLSMYYRRIVSKEIRLADIHEDDRILCVGGGPCPFSGILLHERTKAHVTIIDIDEHCVEVSRQLVKKLGYEDFIEILHGDGSDICPENYTVIHMAVQVCPLDKVFSSIRQKCRLGSKILVRIPKKHMSHTYNISDLAVFNACSGKAGHLFRNIDSTALFIVY